MSETTDAMSPGAAPARWRVGVVLGLAGLFYADAIWNAISHTISMAQSGLTGIGWVTLIFSVIFPAIIYVFAYMIGRHRSVGDLSLVLLAGLGIVAVFWLSLIGYSILNMDALVNVTI